MPKNKKIEINRPGLHLKVDPVTLDEELGSHYGEGFIANADDSTKAAKPDQLVVKLEPLGIRGIFHYYEQLDIPRDQQKKLSKYFGQRVLCRITDGGLGVGEINPPYVLAIHPVAELGKS